MAVLTYSYSKDGNTFLSPHFQVKEFRCKDGSDKILINSDLIAVLEDLFKYLNAKAININSGYRTPSHSVNVGGYSTDQHTKGNAADIVVKKQDGTYYTSNEICLALDDLNHQGGIGRINKTIAVHVDVRGYKCWFDETANMRTLNSWYSYLGVKKTTTSNTTTNSTNTTKTSTTVGSPLKGVDLSYHNGTAVDFNRLKADGISFVILRSGYGRYISQKDSTFENNYKKAKAAGLMVGTYWYSYATDVAGAKAEFNTFMEAIKGKQFEMPVYYDVEESKVFETGKQNVSNIINTFLSACESAGYFAGLYMSRSPLMTYVTDDVQKKYTLWIAEYGSKCNYSGVGRIAMWQNSSTGKVNGVTGNVDTNYLYEDFITKIKSRGLNGFTVTPTIIKGDVNGDGVVNSKDVRDVARIVTKVDSATAEQIKNGDTDGDGKITSKDYRTISRKAAKLE